MLGYVAVVLAYWTAVLGPEYVRPSAVSHVIRASASRAECSEPVEAHLPFSSIRQSPPHDDPTVSRAIELLYLPTHVRVVVDLFAPARFPTLEHALAFRLWRGACVDPVIYVNPRHALYKQAAAAGSDVYPLYLLASVLIHEMQHGEADYSEAAALAAQAEYLRRALPLIPPQRRSNVRGYIEVLEKKIHELTGQCSYGR